MASIFFVYNGQSHEIELAPHLSPITLRLLVDSLPARIDIHCAKIAGQHIFWHAPFLAKLETAQDIMTLPAGTFLYWPERQFVELIYGELQAETAAVTVLGKLSGDIGWLRELGHDIVVNHGHGITWAELKPGAGLGDLVSAGTQPALLPDEILPLRDARRAAWAAQPADVARLLARRGMMLPFGPLSMAEAELRKLHELLWRLWQDDRQYAPADKAQIAVFVLDAAIARVDGFCGMADTGAVLREGAQLLAQPGSPVDALLHELVLYAGRMAAWLDLHICWNDANNCLLNALESGARN